MSNLPEQLPEPKPVTDQLLVLAELDGMEEQLRSFDLALVAIQLDYLGHSNAAAKLGTAMNDFAAAIKYAYEVLGEQ